MLAKKIVGRQQSVQVGSKFDPPDVKMSRIKHQGWQSITMRWRKGDIYNRRKSGESEGGLGPGDCEGSFPFFD